MSDGSVPLKSLFQECQSRTSRLLAELQTSVDALRQMGLDETRQAATEIQVIIDEIRVALDDLARHLH
jgi:hypothetical protein